MSKISNGKTVRLDEGLINLLEKIIEKEKERGREKTSYAVAGEILRRRIEIAGGLKE